MGWDVTTNSYLGAPHVVAMAREVAINGVVTMATAGMPAFSNLIPSSTLPELHDPQSPTPASTKSARCWNTAMACGVTLWPGDFLRSTWVRVI